MDAPNPIPPTLTTQTQPLLNSKYIGYIVYVWTIYKKNFSLFTPYLLLTMLDLAKFDRQKSVLLVQAISHSKYSNLAQRHTIEIIPLISIKITLLFLILFLITFIKPLLCHYKSLIINQMRNYNHSINNINLLTIVNLEWKLIHSFTNWLILFTNSAFVPYTVLNQKQRAQNNDFCLWKFIFHWPNTTFAIGNSFPFGLLFFCVCFLFFRYVFISSHAVKWQGVNRAMLIPLPRSPTVGYPVKCPALNVAVINHMPSWAIDWPAL